jgi:lysophospholipase L1-like esterase
MLRILPFGDSITYGIGSPTSSSYRADLQDYLGKVRKNYQFVGSQVSGVMPQPANEGHPGWQISQLAGIEECTITRYAPNVVLLDIGANDVNANNDLSNAPQRLSNLIDAVFAHAPGATVLVASMMKTTWPRAADMAAYSASSRTMVDAKRAGGRHVAWVDMGAINESDLADGLHPNDSGYRKMTGAWNFALASAYLNGWLNGGGPAGPTPNPACNTPAPIPPPPTDPRRGRAEYINILPNSSATAYLNGGIGTIPGPAGSSSIAWTELGYIASGVAGGAPGYQIRFADLNGDGRAEYINVHPDSSATAYLNGGIGTIPGPAGSSSIAWKELGYIASGVAGGAPQYQILFADLNGQ